MNKKVNKQGKPAFLQSGQAVLAARPRGTFNVRPVWETTNERRCGFGLYRLRGESPASNISLPMA
jgi:hypothetical protein